MGKDTVWTSKKINLYHYLIKKYKYFRFIYTNIAVVKRIYI